MFGSKKARRMLGMLLGAVMLGGVLTGCGGGGGGEKAAADEIRVGANFELTGNVANYGTATFKGLELAVEEANAAGGINGKKIKLIKADTKSDTAEAVNSATKLIAEDKVKVLVGPATTAPVIAETQVATEHKVPILAPCATSAKVTVDNGKVQPYVFRSCFIDPQQGDVMAQFASANLGAKTAVIYIDSSSDYSKSLGAVFKERFEAAGGQVVMEEAFLQKDQDFKATLTKIKTANADVIFIPAYYEEVGKIVKQARELGIQGVILGTDGWDEPKVADIAGKDALNKTYFCTHYSDKDEHVKPFLEAFQKKYNHAPNVFAALGYDAGKLLVDALKRAGSDDPEKIVKALAETKDLKAGTGTISMDANHNPIKQAVVLENRDGDRVVVAKIVP